MLTLPYLYRHVATRKISKCVFVPSNTNWGMKIEYNIYVCVVLVCMVWNCVSIKVYVFRIGGGGQIWEMIEENRSCLPLDSLNLLIVKLKKGRSAGLTWLFSQHVTLRSLPLLKRLYPVVPQPLDSWATIMCQEGLGVPWGMKNLLLQDQGLSSSDFQGLVPLCPYPILALL